MACLTESRPLTRLQSGVVLFADDVERLDAWRRRTGAPRAAAVRALVSLALDQVQGALP